MVLFMILNDINDYHDLMKLMMGEYGVLVVYRGDVVER